MSGTTRTLSKTLDNDALKAEVAALRAEVEALRAAKPVRKTAPKTSKP